MVIADAQTGQPLVCSVCGRPASCVWFEDSACLQPAATMSAQERGGRWFCRELLTAYSLMADASQGVRAV